MSLPERRPSRPVRSPVRTRKITNHGGEGPFAPAVPVHSTVYFTQAPPPPSSDGTYFELVQAILVALVIIATAMAVIVEEVEDNSEPIVPSTYGPRAKALKHAARSGTPFCAQCEAAKK